MNQYIDHTLLNPVSTQLKIQQLCAEADTHRFAAVCINPWWVPYCVEQLKGTGVHVATVVGFPLGASTTEVKTFEAQQAVEDGATEIDMVLNIGALKSKKLNAVQLDIESVVHGVGKKALVKVILESGLLSNSEIIEACELVVAAGAKFVKTSTGFGPSGATIEHVRLMRQTVGSKMGVKASGGIRNRKSALAMIEAGANRIGTSAGVSIVTDSSLGD